VLKVTDVLNSIFLTTNGKSTLLYVVRKFKRVFLFVIFWRVQDESDDAHSFSHLGSRELFFFNNKIIHQGFKRTYILDDRINKMFRRVQKMLYRYAYKYATKCQQRTFEMYTRKYISKHVKYRQRNDEYDLLLEHAEDLTAFLYERNRAIYDRKRTNYTYRLLTDRAHVDQLVHAYLSGPETDDLMHDIASYSVALQTHMFTKIDLVAKTKIQEHWFMRLPVFVAWTTLIYVAKLWNDAIGDQVLVTVVYVVYLVSIRFHQSVSAETKKLGSEIYSNYKNQLYSKMASKQV